MWARSPCSRCAAWRRARPTSRNGSAKDLRGVVDYYERRYDIGYTEQEKQDLVNLMESL